MSCVGFLFETHVPLQGINIWLSPTTPGYIGRVDIYYHSEIPGLNPISGKYREWTVKIKVEGGKTRKRSSVSIKYTKSNTLLTTIGHF